MEAKKETDEIRFIPGSTVSLFIGNTNDKVFVSKTETNEKGAYLFKVEPGKNYVLQFENVKTGRAFIPFSTKGIDKPDTIKIRDYGINFISKEAMVMKNIYYEYGKYKLTKEQKAAIDSSIISLMKQAPEIVIELSSHTDNQGSEEFNLKLSQKRADEIVAYMIKQGIEPNRVSGKGYGFSMPVAKNTNDDGSDNPEGRAKNRRTEFKIVGSVQEMNEVIYE
jgi:outer membrane protein OmpA-like peptidoglycan-associated protein